MSVLKESLEQAINQWVEEAAEAGVEGWSDYWYAGDLQERMAEAAWAVFRAARQAQDFAKEQDK